GAGTTLRPPFANSLMLNHPTRVSYPRQHAEPWRYGCRRRPSALEAYPPQETSNPPPLGEARDGCSPGRGWRKGLSMSTNVTYPGGVGGLSVNRVTAKPSPSAVTVASATPPALPAQRVGRAEPGDEAAGPIPRVPGDPCLRGLTGRGRGGRTRFSRRAGSRGPSGR